jgi:hypothetical protein
MSRAPWRQIWPTIWRRDNPDKTADDYEIAQSCAIKTDDDPRHVEFQNWRELRERAKRNGYRVQKRGDQYKLIPEDGAPVGGDIDTVNAWLDMLETAKTSGQNIEYRTACGMPILTSNFDE